MALEVFLLERGSPAGILHSLYQCFRNPNCGFFEVNGNFAVMNCDPGYEILFVTGNSDNIHFFHSCCMIRKNFLCGASEDAQVISFQRRLMTPVCWSRNTARKPVGKLKQHVYKCFIAMSIC